MSLQKQQELRQAEGALAAQQQQTHAQRTALHEALRAGESKLTEMQTTLQQRQEELEVDPWLQFVQRQMLPTEEPANDMAMQSCSMHIHASFLQDLGISMLACGKSYVVALCSQCDHCCRSWRPS